MMRYNETEKSLRCRDGYPVPVGIGGGKAGPARPLASNCREPLVGNQAGALVSSTGMVESGVEARREPRRRRRRNKIPTLRLKGGAPGSGDSDEEQVPEGVSKPGERVRRFLDAQRSPPARRNSFVDTEEFVTELITGTPPARDRLNSVAESNPAKKKRKATSPAVTGALWPSQNSGGHMEMTKQVLLLDEGLTAMDKFIKEHQNVHVGVKNIVARLNKCGYEIQRAHEMRQRAWDDISDERDELAAKVRTLEARLQKAERGLSRAAKMDGGSQTRTQVEASRAKIAEEIRARLGTVKNVQSAKALFEESWPEETYWTTTVVEGSPLETRDADVVVGGTVEEMAKPSGLARQFADRFPELFDKNIEGVSHIAVATSVCKDGVRHSCERNIYKLTLKDRTHESLLKGLLEVKDKMRETGGRTVHVPKLVGVDETMLRKLVELAWLGEEGLRCIIHVRKMATTAATKTQQKSDKPARKQVKDKVVFVSAEGVSYKDVLSKVRGNLITDNKEVVKCIRETKSGELLIVLDKAADSDKIQSAVLSAMPGAKVVAKGGPTAPKVEDDTVPLQIQGMDALTREEEIDTALKERIGDDQVVNIGPLRKGFGGTLVATARVRREGADKILTGGKILIGPVSCRVRGSVVLKPCLKCHSYDHTTAVCRKRGGTKVCHNCGETGHVRKTCKKESHCVVCGKDGHGSHTGKCPDYKQALKTAIRRLTKPTRETGLGSLMRF